MGEHFLNYYTNYQGKVQLQVSQVGSLGHCKLDFSFPSTPSRKFHAGGRPFPLSITVNIINYSPFRRIRPRFNRRSTSLLRIVQQSRDLLQHVRIINTYID